MYKLSLALKSLAIALLTTSLLSACGFQLRGDYLLDDELQTLYVSSSDIHGELTRLVKLSLTRNQVNVLKRSKADIPELRILSDKLDRRTLSLFSNGQVAEYELIYSVRYQVRFTGEDAKEFRFELYRDYQDDPNLALAKSRELALLLSEMRASAADKILRDLARIQR
ncbi:LPS-assembly lipoprotein LptE [Colwellia psychrerythraea]|uniref:LPS-assembly lipoprotein LptE n=1 Tax=Colwellia psychrerythraea TaxID=28229 RepID=A0A099KV43_COLPS|nr:LPS assembly lipoprotein LptE [Colwellia psychrerythraea]KGJ94075.1 Rare lipoprotein B [Colwellia psychrerythraea]